MVTMGIRKIGKSPAGTEVIRKVGSPNSLKQKKIILGSRFSIPNFLWSVRIHGIKSLHPYDSDRGVACEHHL